MASVRIATLKLRESLKSRCDNQRLKDARWGLVLSYDDLGNAVSLYKTVIYLLLFTIGSKIIALSTHRFE